MSDGLESRNQLDIEQFVSYFKEVADGVGDSVVSRVVTGFIERSLTGHANRTKNP